MNLIYEQPTLSSKPPSVLKINAGNTTEVKLRRTIMTVAKKTIHETVINDYSKLMRSGTHVN